MSGLVESGYDAVADRYAALELEGNEWPRLRWLEELVGTVADGGRHESPANDHAPTRIRTWGLLLRRESLYPAELSGRADYRSSKRVSGCVEFARLCCCRRLQWAPVPTRELFRTSGLPWERDTRTAIDLNQVASGRCSATPSSSAGSRTSGPAGSCSCRASQTCWNMKASAGVAVIVRQAAGHHEDLVRLTVLSRDRQTARS